MTIKNKIVTAQKPKNAKGQFVKTSKKYTASPWIAKDPDPFDEPNLPPGVVPFAPGMKHVNMFRGIANGGLNIYRNLDEALKASRLNGKAMRHDLAIMEPLLARQLATAQLEDHLLPEDPNDPYQKDICDKLTKILRKIPKWIELKRNLLEACWYGKMAVILNFKWEYKNEARSLVVDDWKPINGDKLCWRNNDKEFGYLCHMPTGYREVIYSDIGRAELFNNEDKECIILHKWMVEDAPYDEPELAIGVHGIGIRHIIYWSWWMRQELLGWLFDCFERFGAGGLAIWSFESGNPASEDAVRKAAETQTGNNIILFPRPIGAEKQGPGIEIITPNGVGFEWFYKFIEDYFNGQIRRLIVGSANNENKSSKDAENLIKTEFIRLIKYDAMSLEESINNSLIKVLLKYNFPDYPYEIKYQIAVDKPDSQQFLEAAQRFYELGGSLSESELRGVIGLSEPTKEETILKKSEAEMNPINPFNNGVNSGVNNNVNNNDKTIKDPAINLGDGEDKNEAKDNLNKNVGELGTQLA